jgi:23S rRNA (cytosine1962-C5)-methyltransferase
VKAGHVQPLWAGHPWVFKQAIERADEGLEPGGEALVIDPHGKVLGRGLYSPKSAIAVRMFTHEGSRAIDDKLIRARIERAVVMRQAQDLPCNVPGRETTGYRLVYGEGDALPGLIIDRFGDVLVTQMGSAGLLRMKDSIVRALVDCVGPSAILDRTPKNIAEREGVDLGEASPRVLHGEVPVALEFSELGMKYELPIDLGQKTGFYFDQRPMRERLHAICRGSKVLDAFCYVGGFSLHAAKAGAREVLGVDKSVGAIAAAKRCAELNGVADAIRFEAGDAVKAFKEAEEKGGYDIVICDPPKLAPRRKNRKQAFGGYRKLAAGACGATAPGGLLVFCSCSGATSLDALQRALALGARDVGRRATIVDRCFQGTDHPVAAAFPEGLYLKVLIARIEPI